MTVSALSTFRSGSKKTRLLRHGMAGHEEEMVPVSWTAKPCGRSSRWVMLRVPPDFGAWLTAGPLATSARTTARMVATIEERNGVMTPPGKFRQDGYPRQMPGV